MDEVFGFNRLEAWPLKDVVLRAWRKVAVPLIAAGGVGTAVVLALWLGDGAPGLAPVLAVLAVSVAALRLWRQWPRPRIVVYWVRAGERPKARGGPFVLHADPARDATPRDFASWAAMLVGVAGLAVNTALAAFGAPGLPFESQGLSLAGFFALLCAGLYWRP